MKTTKAKRVLVVVLLLALIVSSIPLFTLQANAVNRRSLSQGQRNIVKRKANDGHQMDPKGKHRLMELGYDILCRTNLFRSALRSAGQCRSVCSVERRP